MQAQIVAALQGILESDEELLGFSRGMIAGGLRGKLTVGFEALFAPCVNVVLTERRVILQHVQPESGKPNEILPHSFPLSDLQSISFTDIETFGAEPAGRLSLRMFNDQFFRLRFRGTDPVDSARKIADVFSSLSSTRPKARTSPTQSLCPHCDQILDQVTRFCPYCGQPIESLRAIEAQDSNPTTAGDATVTSVTSEDSLAEASTAETAPEIPETTEAPTGENQAGPASEWTNDTADSDTAGGDTPAEVQTRGRKSSASSTGAKKDASEGETNK